MVKAIEAFKGELTPIMKKNAKALEDHLAEIEGQIFVMVQGLGSMGAGTAGPAVDPGAPGEPAGMPSGTPNPAGQSAPAFPFPPAVPRIWQAQAPME